MHITQLTTHNLKGRSMRLDLSPVTVIVGENFSGKTSIPMALRLALTGYLPPPIGKQPSSIYSLAGNPEAPGVMSVEVVTDTGRTSKLTYSRSKTGKVSVEGGVPVDMLLPGLLVEPMTFFGMTSAQRTEAVFEACDTSKLGIDQETVCSKLRAITAVPQQYADETIAQLLEQVAEVMPRNLLPCALAKLESDWKEDLKATKNLHAAASASLTALSNVCRDRPSFDKAKYDALNAELNTIKSPKFGDINQAEREHQALINNEIIEQNRVYSLDLELSSLEGMECCPTCGAKKKGWKDAMRDAINVKLEEAKKRHDLLEHQLEASAHLLTDLRAKYAAEVEATQARRDAINAELNTLSQARGELTAWERSASQRNEAEQRLLRYGAQCETYKAAVAIVSEIRQKAIADVFGGVLAVAKGFTDGLLNSPLEFVDGELGRRVSTLDKEDGNEAPAGSWIGHAAFSGTEQLLAYAGFAVALSQQAPIKLVIMDELGRLTTARKAQLLNRMDELVKRGVIDQFVGCDVSPLDGTAARYIVL